MNVSTGDRTFFSFDFFFGWLETNRQQTDALVSLSIFDFRFFDVFQLFAKEQKAGMMIV